MFGASHRRPRRGFLPGLLSVAGLAAILLATQDIDLPLAGGAARTPGSAVGASPGGPCGAASAATIAHVEEEVARRIYVAELRGYEVRTDLAHIQESAELRTALASSNQAAVYVAVHKIVYTPHWHIVRLRVTRLGHVLADVGGPDVIAPVSGALRSKGKVVGRFVMSVQDDLGYTKLVTRFIGAPIELYREGSPVMGTFPVPLAAPRNGQSLTLAGVRYRVLALNATAFPSGKLEAALLVGEPSGVPTPSGAPAHPSGASVALSRAPVVPPGAPAAPTCEAVRVSAWGQIAMHVAARFTPLTAHYEDFVHTLQGVSGGRVFVRSGSARLAGGGPRRLPRQGLVRYRGLGWDVFSWSAPASTRIYFLTPHA